MSSQHAARWSEFSLVEGGLLYRIWQRLHIAGHILQRIFTRIGVMVLLTWIPLLIITIYEGNFWNRDLKLPFLYDIETHLRLLVVLPLLILGETLVHQRLMPIVAQFLNRNIIEESSVLRFDEEVDRAMELRSSVTAEIILLGIVYAIGFVYVKQRYGLLEVPSWRISTAESWYVWVSLPLFQFLLLRWYFRLFIWARFLFRVSKIHLNLVATHSDGCGGLGFLGGSCMAFAPILLAQGTMLSAMMANRIFFAGAKLPEFKWEILSLVAIVALVTLLPLMMFGSKLAALKRWGRLQYGALAQRYVCEFDRKWIKENSTNQEPLIGSADIQSLADLTNAYGVVQRMRLVPFGSETVIQLAVFTLLPVVPLLLTIMPFKDLSMRLIKLVF